MNEALAMTLRKSAKIDAQLNQFRDFTYGTKGENKMIKAKAILPKKDALAKEVTESLKRISEKLEKAQRIQCPDHHQHPQIVVSGTKTKPSYAIQGCCQKLIDQVRQALK